MNTYFVQYIKIIRQDQVRTDQGYIGIKAMA